MIKLTDWIATIPPEDKYIAYVGENETVSREFFLPDLAYKNYDFYLDLEFDLSTVTTAVQPRSVVTTQQSTTEMISADGTSVTATENTSQESYTQTGVTVDQEDKTDIAPLSKSVEDDGIYLYWTVRAQHTQLPGLLRATLRAVGGVGKVKKSAMMMFYVAPSVSATPAVPIQMSEFEQMERAMVLSLQREADKTLAAFSQQLGDAEDLKEYIDQKTAPATADTLGVVRTGDSSITGIMVSEDGLISIRDASGGSIGLAEDNEAYKDGCPVTARELVDYVGSKASPAEIGGAYGTVKIDDPLSSGLEINEDGYLQLFSADHPGALGYHLNIPITAKNFKMALELYTYDKSQIDEKTAPATADTLGLVRTGDSSITGITVTEDGLISIRDASGGSISLAEGDETYKDGCPVTARELVDYVGEKTAPATPDTYGTVKVWDADLDCGVYADNGLLRLCTADMIDVRECEEDPSSYPDFEVAVTPRILVDYVGEKVGNIETALDGILTMQNALIGGDGI